MAEKYSIPRQQRMERHIWLSQADSCKVVISLRIPWVFPRF
jgi:hypothetical protein